MTRQLEIAEDPGLGQNGTAVGAGAAATTSVADREATVLRWLRGFSEALAAKDAEAAAAMFLEDSYWRDLLALTWDLRNFQGREEIAAGLSQAIPSLAPTEFVLDETSRTKVMTRARFGDTIEAYLRFETAVGSCRAHLRLRYSPVSELWDAWTLLTALDQIDGHPELVGENRPLGLMPEGENWLEERRRTLAYEDRDPQVVVVGAGHCGLAVTARLNRLGVDTLTIERNDRVGDNWRNRYRSLYLHHDVTVNDLPYMPFPAGWPMYVGKDKFADWLEQYSVSLDLNIWTGTTLKAAEYDPERRQWRVDVVRADGSERRLHPHHLVLATGVFGDARRLDFEGAEDFAGTILGAHEFKQVDDASGLRVLVIGTGSSAHDVAQDYCLAGAEVTMLQRSTTHVLSMRPGALLLNAAQERAGAGSVEDRDLAGLAVPVPLLVELHKDVTKRVAEVDSEMLEGLERAGFKLDYGDDGSGMFMKFLRNGGGYYIDTGCSRLIVERQISVKQGVVVDHLREKEVVFTDGTSMAVDVIVEAVGWENMQESIRDMFGSPVADRVGPVWGVDEAGEVRAVWRRTGQPGLWIMGGSVPQSRTMSKVLALQIKAQEEGLLP